MDDRTFDARVRALGRSANRRAVLGALAALAGAGAVDASAKRGKVRGSAADDKVTICHYDKDAGTCTKISVGAKAADAHAKHHDDFVFNGCCSDSDCGAGHICDGKNGCVCAGDCCSNDDCDAGQICNDAQVCVSACRADQGKCYWLYPDGTRWVLYASYSRQQCQAADSCGPGGGGQSGGGCYAWMDDSLCKIAPPW